MFGATSTTPDYALFIYYAAFVVIFQIGWASVQISHLSLIPELTSDESEVAGLNGWRSELIILFLLREKDKSGMLECDCGDVM